VILEGIVTTVDAAGAVNIAPMGPIVPDDFSENPGEFTLRPFCTSRTYANLKIQPVGVLHIVDDALLLAKATLGVAEPVLLPADKIHGLRLADCCRYFEFVVHRMDDSQDRSRIDVKVVAHARVRDFFGWNRAKHAVLEAAILASRVHLLPAQHLAEETARLRTVVQKTAGAAESEAFELLDQYIRQSSAAGEVAADA
jgi:hypothetical protein